MAKTAQNHIKDLIKIWSRKMSLPSNGHRVFAKVREQILQSVFFLI